MLFEEEGWYAHMHTAAVSRHLAVVSRHIAAVAHGAGLATLRDDDSWTIQLRLKIVVGFM